MCETIALLTQYFHRILSPQC